MICLFMNHDKAVGAGAHSCEPSPRPHLVRVVRASHRLDAETWAGLAQESGKCDLLGKDQCNYPRFVLDEREEIEPYRFAEL